MDGQGTKKLSKSIHVCQSYNKTNSYIFLRHSVLHTKYQKLHYYYILTAVKWK